MRYTGKKKIMFICANSSYNVTSDETVSAANASKFYALKFGRRTNELLSTSFAIIKPVSLSGEP